MKGCELCGKGGEVGGMMYCEADSARLCWDCDSTVHGANFLVAKHTRVLLCHACHAPTPWRASGSALPHALSLCPSCHVAKEEEGGYSSCDDEDEDDDEVEGENQVVPWSPVPVGGGPPPASSSSSDDEGGVKRLWDDAGDSDLDHDDSEDETTSLPLRKQPRKLLATHPQHHQEQPLPDKVDQICGGRNGSRSTAEIIKRIQTDLSKNEETTILSIPDADNLA